MGGDVSLPPREWFSRSVRSHLTVLLIVLDSFYTELVRALVLKDPDLRFGYAGDRSVFPTWGHPERWIYENDPETGQFKRTNEKRPATDPEAHLYAKRVHSAAARPRKGATLEGADEATKGKGGKNAIRWNFGYALDALCFTKKPILVPGFTVTAPKAGEVKHLEDLLDAKAARLPELRVKENEFGILALDNGYDSSETYVTARRHGLEPLIPAKRTMAKKELKSENAIMVGQSKTFRYSHEFTPRCEQGELSVLPSELGKHRAQRFRRPMLSPGQCPKPCSIEVKYDEAGKLQYPVVKKRLAKVTEPELMRRVVLFPRAGEEFKKLYALRSSIERCFSLIKGKGSWGGESEARLPLRGRDILHFRLLCLLIVLVAQALLDEGIELNGEIADRFSGDWSIAA